MKQGGWQKTWVRVLTSGMTLGLMIMIFAFSTQDAEKSDRTSGFISDTVVRLVYRDYEQMNPASQQSIYAEIQHIVRKCAHFTEYCLLGFMLRLCLESWFGHRKRGKWRLFTLALCAGILYACTDEIHQLMIDGRSGQWTDVLVDSGGVLTGVTAGMLLIGRLIDHNAEGGTEHGVLQKQ